jgi:hypothetical protein
MSENEENKNTTQEKIELVKKHIEYRYQRLHTTDRRPSLEYISTSDIRELFLPFAKDPETFLTLSDEEIQNIYTKWYETYRPDLWERINFNQNNTNQTTDKVELSCQGIAELLADLELPDIVLDN